ncbi:MAG: GLPGLI family protein, partial [Flavobacteriaceae bacterium]|nr:GLPGLI family protein [Flavobacteriaceae bacterium]
MTIPISHFRKMFEKEYILQFNSDVSTYKEDVALDQSSAGGGNMKIMILGAGNTSANDVTYKNVKEGSYTNRRDMQGKLCLVQDQLKKHDWILTKETKNIGQYTVFKATRIESVPQITREGEVLKDVTYTAWYTPQIPVKNGPADYWGLPGLILEATDGTSTLLCTKIVLNPKEGVTIKAPKKGKKVNQAKYDKISKEKQEEMSARMQQHGRGNQSGGFMIKGGH